MGTISPWWPILANLFSLWVGYRIGYRQATTASKALELSITKAAPKIGISLKIDTRQKQSHAFPPLYYLMATIYNEGELPAKQLKGDCKLYSPTNEIQQRDIPFNRDFLGSSPCELESQIVGTTVDAGIRGEQNITINVDIEFSYLAPPNDKPEHYKASYRYDQKSRQFVKAG